MTLNSIYISLIARIQEIISEALSDGISTNLQYHSWDSLGDITELPETDLMGLVDWTYAENVGLSTVNFGILISTINDENLFKMVQMLDLIHNACVEKPGKYKTWRILDQNGEEITQFVVTDFEVMPAGKSELRNTRTVGIELMKTANV
jgi:hypothetical protein